jgi:cytosine/adenosine deaminase-related metal-dependent hydrolase
MTAPPRPDHGVVFSNGVIEAVGPTISLRKQFPDAVPHDAGDAVILPGLVNAHAHLELSSLTPLPNPGHLAEWLIKNLNPVVSEMVERGVNPSIHFGITSIGDITRHCAQTRAILRTGPLRVTSYGEVIAMAARRNLFDERFAAATDVSAESDFLRVGISPHAPYTVEPAAFAKCLQFAKSTSRPIAVHLAETPNEKDFLATQTGPLRQLWDRFEAWDPNVPTFQGGPIRYARHLGLLDYPTVLAHVNFCDDDELAILAAGKASVVYCPRTHAYFGHPPHRWRDMLKNKINVAVGTDSRASSPDLNLVDDLRLLHRVAPDFPPQDVWKLATTNAARAIGQQNNVGNLAPASHADFCIFPAKTADPLAEILESQTLPTQVWIAGHQII